MFFDRFTTVQAVKSEYRRLAKIHHPDVGGDTATMQRINAEYHARLASLNGQTVKGDDGKDHTYYYRRETEQAVMDKIAELLKLQMPSVTIELLGTWIWVHGDTRPVKELLKAAGCRWHAKRVMWYWRPQAYRTQYSGASFDTLRRIYGSQTFEPSDSAVAPA
jgi:hypothetical protein